jgi:hypothetical protein
MQILDSCLVLRPIGGGGGVGGAHKKEKTNLYFKKIQYNYQVFIKKFKKITNI